MKVLGIGETVLDAVYATSHCEEIDLSLLTPEKHIGGTVIAALILLSRLGVDCTLLTTLGRDDAARIIKRTLKHERIKSITKMQKKTKLHTIIVDQVNGQRKKIRGDVVHPSIKHIARKFIRQFDLIILDRHEHAAFYEVLKKKRPETKIIIDPSTEISPFTLDMIKHADYPIIPIEALTKVGHRKEFHICLELLFKLGQKPLTITAGEFGSVLYDGTKINLVPSLQVHAVDVTGAGDIYRGGYAFGIIQGWDLEKCAQFGNLVAAMQCTRQGNVAAIPTKHEIDLLSKMVFQKKEINELTISTYFMQL